MPSLHSNILPIIKELTVCHPNPKRKNYYFICRSTTSYLHFLLQLLPPNTFILYVTDACAWVRVLQSYAFQIVSLAQELHHRGHLRVNEMLGANVCSGEIRQSVGHNVRIGKLGADEVSKLLGEVSTTTLGKDNVHCAGDESFERRDQPPCKEWGINLHTWSVDKAHL